jgi:hypothetical protein
VSRIVELNRAPHVVVIETWSSTEANGVSTTGEASLARMVRYNWRWMGEVSGAVSKQIFPSHQLMCGPPKVITTMVLTVYFGTPNMFITLWFGFDYETNLPLGTLII